jgi:hypothetical protein
LRDSNRPGLLEENDAALREIAAQLKVSRVLGATRIPFFLLFRLSHKTLLATHPTQASTVLLCKSLQRKPGTAANIMKVQGERKCVWVKFPKGFRPMPIAASVAHTSITFAIDRRFAQELLDTTTLEIMYEGTFSVSETSCPPI